MHPPLPPGETMPLGCMHINALANIKPTPLNLAEDEAWAELLMGQGGLVDVRTLTPSRAKRGQLQLLT